MKKIGIIACAITTKILDCPLSPCLRDFYDRKGEFGRYRTTAVELAGVISCQGCQGGMAPEAILAKANSLIHYGIEVIHLTYCMMILCPFIKNHIKTLKETYPDVEIILGTHEPHDSQNKLVESISNLLKQRTGNACIP